MNRSASPILGLISICLFLGSSAFAAEEGSKEAPSNSSLQLEARSRVETSPGSGQFETVRRELTWDPHKTAIVICDMWDRHWCKGATRRVAEMAPRMNEVINAARQQGVFIIHAPSDTMEYYQGTPQRELAQSAPEVTPKVPLENWCHLEPDREAPLPIDDSDGGCNDWPRCEQGSPWTKQIGTLEIKEGDAITDSAEAYYLMEQRGIENVIVMGVHVNMCVLGRPFAIRQMVKQDKNVVLMRDLTDSMYNSRQSPYVNHFRGTELVVEHIEKYWCPSITSTEFVSGQPFEFSNQNPPHIVFMIGEKEYRTRETLPEFAKEELVPRGFKCSFVHVNPDDPNDFPGLKVLNQADLLFLSVRRRTPPQEQLNRVRQHLRAGKALVGIRTASHAFDADPPDPAHAAWPNFDREILGAHYQGHYGNQPPDDPPTWVQIHPNAADHPILNQLPSRGWASTAHLYKNRDLAGTVTPLLQGKIQGRNQTEPVAWINTAAQRRAFYTSLGNPADFKTPGFRRLLLNGIAWALETELPSPGETLEAGQKNRSNDQKHADYKESASSDQSGPLSPPAALEAFHTADDLQIETLLAEPVVRQPVFLNFDERGRMWVVQYMQYPNPAGLKMISHDKYWRAVYDKVPPPPPNHFPGRDKITIHEDTNGDGKFDRNKTFLDGLNIVTAVAHGRGGVWVLNPPYLLFYPDHDKDDVPDGDPEVHLKGFGLEDTHSVVNSLRWGPDGWLYAAQGSTVSGQVTRPDRSDEPVYSMGQLIWRYHPETRRYEIFAEGGGNAFGVELDAKGRIFSGHNGGNTRGFHYVQGGYYRKGFSKHGPLSNPYAFGYFPSMGHHDVPRFTHTFVIYDGGSFPKKYDGNLFGVEPLQGRVVRSDVQPDGSTFQTRDLDRPVTTRDDWFRPVDIKLGPDGALYIADWYDEQVNHYRNHEGEIDKSNGRIYRLKAKGTSPQAPFNLNQYSTGELIGLLQHDNKWFRQTALRLLGDRRDPQAMPTLKKMLANTRGQLALETFWALNVTGGFNEQVAFETLDHDNPYVRLWTIRLSCDDRRVSSTMAQRLEDLAQTEPHVEVRSQLACSARRLPGDLALPIVRNLLARHEDASDPHLPLLLWWALEDKADSHSDRIVKWFSETRIWDWPIVKEHILERLMRRYAMAGSRNDLLICADLLNQAPRPDHRTRLMKGFEQAFKGRSLANLPSPLGEALARDGAQSLALQLRQGHPQAVRQALQIIEDEQAPTDQRRQYIQILGEVNQPSCVPVLLDVVRDSSEPALTQAALNALQQYPDADIATQVIELYEQFPEPARTAAQVLLASRNDWSRQFLLAVDQGTLKPDQVPMSVVQQIQAHQDPRIDRLISQHWTLEPSSSEQSQHRIDQFTRTIRAGSGNPYEGKELYDMACAACHRLFDHGGEIGPDLTTYQRDDLDTMLLNIVQPSAEIREGFETYIVTTHDGRTLTGFLADQDNQVIVLRGLDGQDTVLERDEVKEMKPAGRSLMPEGLLASFQPQQLRDLFAYLRSAQPLNE